MAAGGHGDPARFVYDMLKIMRPVGLDGKALELPPSMTRGEFLEFLSAHQGRYFAGPQMP